MTINNRPTSELIITLYYNNNKKIVLLYVFKILLFQLCWEFVNHVFKVDFLNQFTFNRQYSQICSFSLCPLA